VLLLPLSSFSVHCPAEQDVSFCRHRVMETTSVTVLSPSRVVPPTVAVTLPLRCRSAGRSMSLLTCCVVKATVVSWLGKLKLRILSRTGRRRPLRGVDLIPGQRVSVQRFGADVDDGILRAFPAVRHGHARIARRGGDLPGHGQGVILLRRGDRGHIRPGALAVFTVVTTKK
jgi:hypothetical protein